MTLKVTGIERISVSAGGVEGDGDSLSPVMSPDGRHVLFVSEADNLIAGSSLPAGQLYIKDLDTGAVTLVSNTPEGDPANRVVAAGATFSPDGSQVLFSTYADNLVDGDGNHDYDVFVKDLTTGTVTLVSRNSFGYQGDEGSIEPSFSHDGTKVAFMSDSFNFPNIEFDGANEPQIYVKDLVTGVLIAVSTDASGTYANSIGHTPVFSPDDTLVAFESNATNLVPGDDNNGGDIFVKNLTTGDIRLISTDSAGLQIGNTSFNPVWSPDGTKIAFQSAPVSTDHSVIYIKDLVTGALTQVDTTVAGTAGNGASVKPVWSPDGTRLLFLSAADNLVAGDHNGVVDVFVKDLITGVVSRIDAPAGVEADGASLSAAFSADGTQVVISSAADNLVAGDGNGHADVFVVALQDDGVVTGTGAAEHLNGRDVAETFTGGGGNDVIRANGGDDRVYGGTGKDTLYGGDGRDSLNGGAQDDHLHGNLGDDQLSGDDGDDVLYADGGNDFLSGDAGADTLYGGAGSDKLRGGNGDDALYGGTGQDDLRGDDGRDTLNGGSHGDSLYGGGAADRFVFDADAFVGGRDVIKDFSQAAGDVLVLDHILAGFDPWSGDIADFVSLKQVAGSTYVAVDRDGSAAGYGFQTLFEIHGVTGLDVHDLWASGTLVVV